MTIEIQTWPVAKLVPYARALRRNDDAVDRMVAAITEYNFILPLLVRSDGEIVDGHLRLKAARKLQITEVQVIVCDDWTPAQVKAFRLLINRSATWAKWDWKQVALEIADLVNLNFDLALTGFDRLEIDKFLLELRGEDSDAPDPPGDKVPVSSLQDLWLCGAHRILCGDSTKADDIGRLFGDSKPDLMVTDPPYGVSYDPTWREEAGLGKQRQTGKVVNDDRVDWSEAYKLFPGNVAYVWHAGIYARESADSLVASGFTIRSQIIWAKQHFAMSRGDYHWQHEPCWYAVRNGQSANWRGGRKESTLWEVSNLNPFGAASTGDVMEDAVTGHGTQKPVTLMRRPMLNHTEKGAVVYDPFLGSGSTLIAAHSVDRTCYGTEISPGYVDTVIERWQTTTGQAATREADGRSFDDLRAERDAAPKTETAVSEISGPEDMTNGSAQV